MAFTVNGQVAQLSLDSGCEGDCIRLDECKRLNLPIRPLDSTDTSVPTQADGQSPLKIIGKVMFHAIRDKVSLKFDGYVTQELQSPILCGAPFLDRNKIVQELHNQRIVIDGKYYIGETSPYCPNPIPAVSVSNLSIGNVSLNKIEIGDSVPKKIRERLNSIHQYHEKVFDGDISEGYNGYSGDFQVNFNFLNDIPPPISYGCVPSYNKPEDDTLLQAMIDRLESLNVVAKANDLGVIPKFASPCMLVKKNSTKKLPPGVYEGMSIEEKVSHNRFVLCLNKLNPISHGGGFSEPPLQEN